MNQTANMSATTLLEVSDDQPTEGDDYQYEYDVDESLVNYDWSELVPAVVVYSTILLLEGPTDDLGNATKIFFLGYSVIGTVFHVNGFPWT